MARGGRGHRAREVGEPRGKDAEGKRGKDIMKLREEDTERHRGRGAEVQVSRQAGEHWR